MAYMVFLNFITLCEQYNYLINNYSLLRFNCDFMKPSVEHILK